MFTQLERILEKPRPFAEYTAADLWNDPHTSAQMLAFHLNPDVDISSRRSEFINASADWMINRFQLSPGKRVIDFGCGPGLYTTRLSMTGAEVTGVDFSARSIHYARKTAKNRGLDITYHQADYLQFQPGGPYDLILMIMCDFCALSPEQRSVLISKFKQSLATEGYIVFDVYSLAAFDEKQEGITFEKNLLNGFWSPYPYYGFLMRCKYTSEKVGLDKYIIIEKERQRVVYNWLQYFSPQSLEQELHDHNLAIASLLGNVAGAPFDPHSTEFAVVVKKK